MEMEPINPTCKDSRVLIWRKQEERDGEKKSLSCMQMKEGKDQLKWARVGLDGIGKF